MRSPGNRAEKAGRWIAWLLVLAALAALVHGCRLWWPKTVDDAFITYHYARNLVEGLGPNYNAGERLEGYSSPSWMLATAAAIAAGVDPVPFSKWLGLGCSVALLLLLFLVLQRLQLPAWGAGLATLLCGSSFVLQIWSVSGMETTCYALLLFAGLCSLCDRAPRPRAAARSSALLAAAALTRPEGLAFWAAGLALTAVEGTGGDRGERMRRTRYYAIPGLALVLHFAWRVSYYADPFPNTYHVKTGGGPAMWKQGLQGLREFTSDPSQLIWVVAAVAGAVGAVAVGRNVRPVAIMSGAVLAHLLYVVVVGDDALRVHRFYVPILAPLAFLAGQLFLRRGTGNAATARIVLGALAVATAVPLSAARLQAMAPALQDVTLAYLEGNTLLGRHLLRTREPDTLIAVAAAGAIPYYSRLPTIDMYGLNDRHIARVPFPETRGARLMKYDNDYVLEREPDLIVINRGYFRAGDPTIAAIERNPGALATSNREVDLFRKILSDGSYVLRPIRFDDGSVFFVFRRLR